MEPGILAGSLAVYAAVVLYLVVIWVAQAQRASTGTLRAVAGTLVALAPVLFLP